MEDQEKPKEKTPKDELSQTLFGTDSMLDEEEGFHEPNVYDLIHFLKDEA